MTHAYTDVLDFWYKELSPSQWFKGGDELDKLIQARFEKTVRAAVAGELDDWADTPRGRLALIIVLDQFTRNIFRNSGESFAYDEKAQKLTREGLEKNMDENLIFSEKHFFYMPLMHAEDVAMQKECVEKFKELKAYADNILWFADWHLDVVEKFGRFPHRNALLGRSSTPEEEAFLVSDDNLFKH